MSSEKSIATGQQRAAKTEGLRRVRDDKVNLMHTDDYVCIGPATPLYQAIEVMKRDEGGCAIVCDGDQVVATKGSAAAPLVVDLQGTGGAALAAKKKTAAPPPKPKESDEGPSWYFALGVGSGFGWTTGTGEVYNKDIIKPGGFAAAQLGQVLPQVGYFLSPDFMLSVQLRVQKVSGATPFYPMDATTCGPGMVCAPPSLAISGFARANYFFHFDDLHPFVSGLAGGGTIRHVASFPSMPKCGTDRKTTCVDTFASGPIFVGAGGGILYNISPAFALTAESNLVAGFTKFTFNVDINVGVAFEY